MFTTAIQSWGNKFEVNYGVQIKQSRLYPSPNNRFFYANVTFAKNGLKNQLITTGVIFLFLQKISKNTAMQP